MISVVFFFQAEDGIRDLVRSRGLGDVYKRQIEKVWDVHFDRNFSVIDVYINALRKKLDDAGHPSLITTIRGVGYKIESDE